MKSREDLSLLTAQGGEAEGVQLVRGRRPADGQGGWPRAARGSSFETDRRDGATPGPVAVSQSRPVRAWQRADRLLDWRVLGAFWTGLLAATGIGALCLQIAGPPLRRAHLTPTATVTAKSSEGLPAFSPTPQRPPVGSTLSPPETARRAGLIASEPHGPEPQEPSQPGSPASPGHPVESEPPIGVAGPMPGQPPAIGLTQPTEAEARRPEYPPAVRSQADGLIEPHTQIPSATARDADPARPALLIHYPAGSALAEADAQRLAAQADPASQNSVVPAPAGASSVATIRYSDVKDHASAQALGKALQKLGYRWRIEKTSERAGEPPASVEVWMPTK